MQIKAQTDWRKTKAGDLNQFELKEDYMLEKLIEFTVAKLILRMFIV